jgi:nicotinate-nucleotide pyrophosphorylase (carboxylating)
MFAMQERDAVRLGAMDLNALPLPELYRRLSEGGLVRRLLELARDEDVGREGDVTSLVCIPAGERANAEIVARSAGIVCGLALLRDLIDVYGTKLELRLHAADGQEVKAGTPVASMSGLKRDLLTVERAALNIVGRLSGIATRTAAFVREMTAAGPVRARIYDTRKTTPGLRVLEKYAVRCGGGMCHRIGLFDGVLIKDNHIAGVGLAELARVVAAAATRARAHGTDLQFVEVEVDSLEQLERVLSVEPSLVDIVLLDNMRPALLQRAVAMRDASGSRPELEASGGVSLDSVRAIAETGVERISAGTLTHGAVWADVAMDVVG